MALNQIGTWRFQRRLTKELRIPGDEPSPVLAPEIQPVIVVEGERPELLHLAREDRFMTSLALGAIVAEYPYFHLWNPANSRSLVVVEKLYIGDASGANNIDIGPANAAFVASLAGRAAYCLDQRTPQNPLGRPGIAEPMMGTDVNTGGIAAMARLRFAVEMLELKDLGYVIVPGQGFGVWWGTVNHTTNGFCIWRERQAEDGELT